VIQAGVIRDKIEHQPQATLAQAVTEAGQRRTPAQGLMHRVGGNGEPGPSNVIFAKVRQSLLEFFPPLGITAGNLLSGWTCLPNAQHPDPIKPQMGQAV
jgi:hypothetical protein